MKPHIFASVAVCLSAALACAYPSSALHAAEPSGPLLSAPAAFPAPDRERDFVAMIERARKDFVAAKSVDARRGARLSLQIDTHNFMGLTHDAKNWVGIFKQSRTQEDGRMALQIEIAPNVTVSTSTNEYEDHAYGTLIKPYSAIGKIIGSLSIGQPVRFSANLIGSIISSDEDMVLQPRIVARFIDFTVLDEPPQK